MTTNESDSIPRLLQKQPLANVHMSTPSCKLKRCGLVLRFVAPKMPSVPYACLHSDFRFLSSVPPSHFHQTSILRCPWFGGRLELDVQVTSVKSNSKTTLHIVHIKPWRPKTPPSRHCTTSRCPCPQFRLNQI